MDSNRTAAFYKYIFPNSSFQSDCPFCDLSSSVLIEVQFAAQNGCDCHADHAGKANGAWTVKKIFGPRICFHFELPHEWRSPMCCDQCASHFPLFQPWFYPSKKLKIALSLFCQQWSFSPSNLRDWDSHMANLRHNAGTSNRLAYSDMKSWNFQLPFHKNYNLISTTF